MTDQTFTFLWDIRKYSFISLAECQDIHTDPFVVPMLDDTSWKVLLYPRGHHSNEFISIFVQRQDDCGPETIELSVNFRLLNRDGSTTKESPTLRVIFSKLAKSGFNDFASVSELDRYLCNDVLRIQCVFRKSRVEFSTKNVNAVTNVDVQNVSQECKLPKFSLIRNGHHTKLPFRIADGTIDLNLHFVGRIGMEVIKIQFRRTFHQNRNTRASSRKFTLDTNTTDHQNDDSCNDDKTKPLTAIARLTVLAATGEESDISMKDRHVFTSLDDTWDFPTFLYKSEIMKQKTKYLLKNALTLKCVLSVSTGKATCKIINAPISVSKCYSPAVNQYKTDMEDLYKTMRFSDIKLHASEDGSDFCSLSAHRFLLEARSKKFADLLETQEDTNELLVIPDLSTRTLNSLLKYMYTSEVEDFVLDDINLEGVVDFDFEGSIDLYRAAHKYQVKSLQCHYSFVFQSLLCVDNVCEFLSIADECADVHLKNCAIDFILRYFEQVTESEEWKKLVREKKWLAQLAKDKANTTFVLKHCLKVT